MTIVETVVPKDIDGKVSWLLKVYEQIKDANTGNSETRAVGKQLDKSALAVNDNAELISQIVTEKTGKTLNVDDVYALATVLGQYADFLTPTTATTLWKDEQVQKVANFLKASVEMGDVLTEEQEKAVTDVISEMGKSSTRTVKGPVETLTGHPTKVLLFDINGNEIGKGYSGNTRASAGNIATRVASLTEVSKDDNADEYTVIRNLANQVVDGRTEDVSYKTITMRPVFEESEEA